MKNNSSNTVNQIESLCNLPNFEETLYASFDSLDKVNEILALVMPKEKIEQLQQDENEIILLSIFIGRQLNVYRKMFDHFTAVNEALKTEYLYETYNKVANELNELTASIEKRFPKDLLEKCQLFRVKKKEFEELILIENEVKNFNQAELEEQVNKLREENSQKKKLMDESIELQNELQKLEGQINGIDTTKIDTSQLIKALDHLIAEVKKSTVGKSAVLELRSNELDEEKSKLAAIELQLNRIEKLLERGAIGVEISNFFPKDFEGSKISELTTEINKLSKKLKELIQQKEELADNLKETK